MSDIKEEAPVRKTRALVRGAKPMNSSNTNNIKKQDQGQARPKFDWSALRKAIAFYESEKLCYLPAGWGRKNPSVKWEPYQNRTPTREEKAEWFHEGMEWNFPSLRTFARRSSYSVSLTLISSPPATTIIAYTS